MFETWEAQMQSLMCCRLPSDCVLHNAAVCEVRLTWAAALKVVSLVVGAPAAKAADRDAGAAAASFAPAAGAACIKDLGAASAAVASAAKQQASIKLSLVENILNVWKIPSPGTNQCAKVRKAFIVTCAANVSGIRLRCTCGRAGEWL